MGHTHSFVFAHHQDRLRHKERERRARKEGLGTMTREQRVAAVTGATGFIGAHIVSQLLDEGYVVHACVRDPENENKVGFLKQIAHKKNDGLVPDQRLKFFRCDLMEKGSFDEACRNANVVIHSAAVVDLSGRNNDLVVNAAVEGTRNVLQAAVQSTSVKRMVLISSVSAILDMNKPPNYVFTESDFNLYSTPENGDAYGYAKRLSEQIFWDETKAAGLEAVSINPSMVIGPALSAQHCRGTIAPIYRMLSSAKEGKIPSYKMYHSKLRFVDVRDVAKATVKALSSKCAVGKRNLLCNDAQPTTFGELLPLLAKASPAQSFHLPVKEPTKEQIAAETNTYFNQYILRTGPVYSNAKSKAEGGLMREGYLLMKDTLADTTESLVTLGEIHAH